MTTPKRLRIFDCIRLRGNIVITHVRVSEIASKVFKSHFYPNVIIIVFIGSTTIQICKSTKLSIKIMLSSKC
jgi:hypothetical protein